MEKPQKSSKINLLDLLGLEKELGPIQYCMNKERHGDRKELAYVFDSFPIRTNHINWLNSLYFHFWVDQSEVDKDPEEYRDPDDIVYLVASSLSGDNLAIECELCISTVGASSEQGVRIPKPSYYIGESLICPRCGEEGKLGFAMRKDKKYLAVYHEKFRHLLRTTEPIKHTEKEECPRCHELGRRYEDKQGSYFVHYDKGKRRKCRI